MAARRLHPSITKSHQAFEAIGNLERSTVEEKDAVMGWLNGVCIHEFVNENARGSFQGRDYTGAELTAAESPNHVSIVHVAWVESKVQKLVYQGRVAEWSKVANVLEQPRPA